MRKYLALFAVVAVVMAGMAYAADKDEKEKAKPAAAKADKPAKAAPETLTGEVLDLACYTDHAAHGDGHKGCAKKCLEGGSPVGLLVGDKAYLVAAHGDDAAFKEIRTMGGEKVKVTGVVSNHGGLPAITIEKVEKAG